MDKGVFQIFAFIIVIMVVGVIATAVMISSTKAAAESNGTVVANGTNGNGIVA